MIDADMPRLQKVMLYTLCLIEGLIDKGFVDGPKTVSEKGWESFEAMKEEGFKPTDEETEIEMAAITGGECG